LRLANGALHGWPFRLGCFSTKDTDMMTMLGLFNLGGGEIVLILALVLILFGAKKLPELAKGLGNGIKEFKKATRETVEQIENKS
jgi:sec-independent protein translocase protein TatA